MEQLFFNEQILIFEAQGLKYGAGWGGGPNGRVFVPDNGLSGYKTVK